MTAIKTAPLTDTQRLAIGIYSHVIVNRNRDVKNVLTAAGIAPGETIYENSDAVKKAFAAGNKQVTSGMQNLMAQEIAKVPVNKSRYSNFWNVLVGMLGSSTTNTSQPTSSGNSGGVWGGVVSAAGGIPVQLMDAIQGFGSGKDSKANNETLYQLNAMQVAKQQSQTKAVIYVVFGILLFTMIGVYAINKKAK